MSTAVFSVKVSSLVASWKEHSGNSRKTTNKSKTLIRQLPQSGQRAGALPALMAIPARHRAFQPELAGRRNMGKSWELF